MEWACSRWQKPGAAFLRFATTPVLWKETMVSDSEDQAGSDSLSAGTHPANNVNQAKDKAKDDHQEDQGAGHGLLPGFVATMLGLGSFLYVLGFVVIVVHTSRLRVPMIEALRFQNI